MSCAAVTGRRGDPGTLLATGLPRVTATVSNALGLIPGSIGGVVGYRRELRGRGWRVALWSAGAALGALTGAALLLTLPAKVFETVVPVLVGLALVLVAVQSLIRGRVQRRRARVGGSARPDGGPFLLALFFLVAADFDWTAVVLLAIGSAAGGQAGARVGRRLSPAVLRTLIVTVGSAAILMMLTR